MLKTLGKYEKLDVLGSGVSGIVYLAKDTLLNRQVALKEVDVQAGDVKRFLEEARVIDRLRHPNIVRVHGVDRIEDKIVIDMEYVRGANLQEMLRGEGALSVDRALDLCDQILDALAYAHSQQTVHRDIKPANILVNREGVVKLVDFGLAEILATNSYADGAGTYAYMAPEDFAAEGKSDHQSDLWAVGVTLYEMLTLARPFVVSRPKDPFAWKRIVENEAAIPLSDVLPTAPPDLVAVLNRALAKAKRRRYPTADAFRDDILHLRKGEPISAETRAAFAEKDPSVATHRSLPFSPPSTPVRDTPSVAEPRTRRWNPMGEPGVVVADVAKAAMPFANPHEQTVYANPPQLVREGNAVIKVEPAAIDFRNVRQGERKEMKIRVHISGEGVKGRVIGSVRPSSDWLVAQPSSFDRLKQSISITARGDRAGMPGVYQDVIEITTEYGVVEVPVQARILKRRANFLATSLWFVPLFAAALAPSMAAAYEVAIAHSRNWLAPPAALATGSLMMMLLLMTIAADTGFAEKIACGMITAAMCFALGASLSAGHLASLSASYLMMTAVLMLTSLVLQAMSLRQWKFWGVALLGLSGLLCGAFLRAGG